MLGIKDITQRCRAQKQLAKHLTEAGYIVTQCKINHILQLLK